MMGPKAESVTEAGESDGFEIQPGFCLQVDPRSGTRLVVSVPASSLGSVHQDLIRACTAPLSVLYRQKVDRGKPRPEGAAPRDFVAVELACEVVVAALQECASLAYHDARAEIWVRGRHGEQVILDSDGLAFCYPDDPLFRDVCVAHGLSEARLRTMAERDYVKHWYHAANDAVEAGFIEGLGLSEMSAEER